MASGIDPGTIHIGIVVDGKSVRECTSPPKMCQFVSLNVLVQGVHDVLWFFRRKVAKARRCAEKTKREKARPVKMNDKVR